MDRIVHLPMKQPIRDHLFINSFVALVSFSVVGLRVLGRIQGVGIGWDDCLIMLAVVMATAQIVIQGIYSTLGEGYHMDPSTPEHPVLMSNLPLILRVTMAFQLLYLNSLGVIKLSVLSFYLRVFVSEGVRLAIKITMGAVVLWAASHALGMVFICSPVPYQWDMTYKGTCGNQIALYASLIITNIVTDIFIMALRVHTIWHLQMRTSEKLGLTACFTLGTAVVITACFRLAFVFQVDMRIDLTGTMELAIFLCIFEVLLGILCVSIPMLRPVYARLRTKTRTASHPSGSNPDDLEAIYQRPRKPFGGRLGLQDPTLNTHDHPENVWEMKDYDPGRPKVGHDGFVTAGPAPNEDQSDDGGSERKLTQAVTHGTIIQVERKWTIHRD
ncbi:hypothetical protein PG984_011159 [Apiospora sp. TS-2023a]